MSEIRPERRAPEIYERTVPIVLGAVLLLIVILGLITFAVLFDFWPN